MESKTRATGFLSCLLLLLGLCPPVLVQAAEAERVQVQVAGMV